MDKKKIARLFNKKAVWEIMSLIFSAVFLLADVNGFSPEIKWQYFAMLGILIFAFLVYRRMSEYIEKNDDFENARPNIISFEPRLPKQKVSRIELVTEYKDFTDESDVVNSTTTTSGFIKEVKSVEVKEEYTFAVVDFNNQPIEPMATSEALNVAGWVTYFQHNNTKPLLEELRGRWWSNPEVEPLEDPTEKERVNILPNKQKVTLALAFADGKNIYAYNNESHKTTEGAKEFRLRKFLLGSDKYDIRVILVGTHLKESEHWFSLYINEEGSLASNKIEMPQWTKAAEQSVHPTASGGSDEGESSNVGGG